MKNLSEAQDTLEKGLLVAPDNPLILIELGFIHQEQKRFHDALGAYQRAESNLKELTKHFDDAPLRVLLGRAMRGVGFNMIELEMLDDAEKKYKECLLLNPNDQKAAKELVYISKLKNT